MTTVLVIATARTQIADYLSTLIDVYTLLIFLYIVSQLLFSVGLRPSYSRSLDAVLGFLRKTVPERFDEFSSTITDNFRVIDPKEFRILA